MKAVKHRSRNHSMRGQNVMKANNVDDNPDCQPMILRLGMNVSDINSSQIDRVEYVSLLAGTIWERKQALR